MGEGSVVAGLRRGDVEASGRMLQEPYGTYVSARQSSTERGIGGGDAPDIAEFSFSLDPSVIYG